MLAEKSGAKKKVQFENPSLTGGNLFYKSLPLLDLKLTSSAPNESFNALGKHTEI